METDVYLTIAAPVQAEYKEKGSKFFIFAFPIETEQEIKGLLQAHKKKYYDATHVCSAYILGAKQQVMKANDDGEPAHTAGTPILNQIRSRNLTNVLLLVVRYFGGTKLGVSGLIEAYKESASTCLENCTIVEHYVLCRIKMRFPATIQGEAMRLIKEQGAKICSQDYENEIVLLVDVRKSLVKGFISATIQGLSMELIDE